MQDSIFRNPKFLKAAGIIGKVVLCLVPIMLLVLFFSKIDIANSVNNPTTAQQPSNEILQRPTGNNATQESTTSGEMESQTEEETEDIYQVTEGQEAINQRPSKNYVGATETDKFFENAVFVGDSITVGWANYANSKGAGFFGDPIFLAKVGYSVHSALSVDYAHPEYDGVRDYIYKAIEKMDVDKVFISFGLNDSLADSDKAIGNYERLINLILRYSPDVDIYVISTTYVTKGRETQYIKNSYIREYNEKLSIFCATNEYTFIDVSSYLQTTDGYLPRAYSSDGYVHLNAKAYDIWETVLRNLAQVEIDMAAGKEMEDIVIEELPTQVEEGDYIPPQTEKASEGETESQSGTQTETGGEEASSEESSTEVTEESSTKEDVTKESEKPTEPSTEGKTEPASEEVSTKAPQSQTEPITTSKETVKENQ